METLFELFPHLTHYIELIPVACVALLSGVISYFNNNQGEDKKSAMKTILTSAFLALMAYTMLSATDLPYLAKIGVSAAIGFFGIDQTIAIVQKILSLRNNGGQSDREKTAEIKESVKRVKKKPKEQPQQETITEEKE